MVRGSYLASELRGACSFVRHDLPGMLERGPTPLGERRYDSDRAYRSCAVQGFPHRVQFLTLTGCAYRLPGVAPPSQQLVRIVANAPEQYTVQVNTGAVTEYDVPHDGRIQIGIPSYRPSCGVYLFNAIKVRGYGDPLNRWIVSITRNGKIVRKQSLRVTQKSPTDEAGYHMMRIGQ